MHRSALVRFVALYAAMYGAFGASSPFMPRVFEARGLSPEEIGVVFGLATAARLVSGPVAGRVADLLHRHRSVLATCTVLAACLAIALLRTHAFVAVLVVALAQAAALAPTTTLADALALSTAASPRAGFEYGWVRGSASASFVVGSLVTGRVLRSAPLDAILWLQAGLLGCAVVAAGFVPPLDAPAHETKAERSAVGGVGVLLGMPAFRRVLGMAALVLGSHAMHDAFAMVRWNAAGIGPGAASLLWSESVVAEVVMFFVVGPMLLARMVPGTAMAIAAVAGVVRWTVMATTAAPAALALVQPLHGFTFALLHLACMRAITALVGPHLAATAQALYAVGATATTAVLTLVSGVLVAHFGPHAFLAMALVCVAALVPDGLRWRARYVTRPVA